MWSADNDEVWNIMEPIVRLASRILTSVHVMPWVWFSQFLIFKHMLILLV
jgi:hypothetical protein